MFVWIHSDKQRVLRWLYQRTYLCMVHLAALVYCFTQRTRYQEDIELAHQVGSTTFRFSFEWGRLEPTRGKFDPAAIKR